MSASTTFVVRSLRRNATRTAVTVVGIALAAVLLTGVFTTFTSLQGFLLDVEKASSGTWSAAGWTEDNPDLASALEKPEVEDAAKLTEVGTALLPEEEAGIMGRYLFLEDYQGDPQVAACTVESGHMPDGPGQIVLPKSWEGLEMPGIAQGALQIGSKVTLDVGRRVAVDPGSGQVISQGAATESGIEGGPLTKDDPVYDAYGEEPSVDFSYAEQFESNGTETFEIVGFYDAFNSVTASAGGRIGLVSEPDPQGPTKAFFVLSGFHDKDQMSDFVAQELGYSVSQLHSSLLSCQMVSGNSGIWKSVFTFVEILAVIIVVACVSLIYNAFAISVTERIRQFGLLASVGATRRQIRDMVLVEALLVGVCGTVLGIVLGLIATAITIQAVSPIVSTWALGSDTGFDFNMVVNPVCLLIVAVLTMVTVLVSVIIPAVHASRVNVIEVLRGANQVKDLKPAALRGLSDKRPWQGGKGLFVRLFGIGGTLAGLTRKRSKGKGRVAAWSICVSMMLLLACGGILDSLNRYVDSTGHNQGSDACLFVEPAYPQDSVSDVQEANAEAKEVASQAARELSGIDGVTVKGVSMDNFAVAKVPRSVAGGYFEQTGSLTVGEDALEGFDATVEGGANVDSSELATSVTVCWLDDDTFRTWAQSNGFDAQLYFDAVQDGRLRAVGVKDVQLESDGKVWNFEWLRSAGDVQLALQGAGGIETGKSPYVDENNDVMMMEMSEGGMDEAVPVPDGSFVDVEVSDLASDGPGWLARSEDPTLVMPLSMKEALPGVLFRQIGVLYDEDDPIMVFQQVNEWCAEAQKTFPGVGLYTVDNAMQRANMMQIVLVVSVFAYILVVLLTLMALGNMFNTLASSLALRKREFAVLRSVGMDDGQFHKMVVCECLGYSLRGYVPGVILGVLASYGMWLALDLSLSGVSFAIPWAAIGASLVLLVVVVGVSVAYGLRKARADSIVAALKTDTM